ncbi:hypothetical protein HC928_24610 [bacterium]|nr:hypothetical protein [bacterium]
MGQRLRATLPERGAAPALRSRPGRGQGPQSGGNPLSGGAPHQPGFRADRRSGQAAAGRPYARRDTIFTGWGDDEEANPKEEAIASLEAEAEAQREFLATEPDREAITASREALLERLAAAFPPQMLIQMRVLLATIPLWEADRLGLSEPQSWLTTQGVLLDMGLLSAEIDLEAAYTNAFLPDAPVDAEDNGA